MHPSLSFRLLWIGQSLANLGDSLYILAIVTLIYQWTGSATLGALVPVVRLFSQLISGLIAPLLLERFKLLPLLVISQAGQTLLFTGLTLLCILVPSAELTGSIWWLIAAISFFDGWSTPARNALVPRLVSKEQLVKANGLLSTTDQTLLLLGWSLGGMLAAAWGSGNVLWLTVVFFIVSTLSLFFIRDPAQRDINPQPETKNWKVIKDGWQTLFSHPVLKRVTLMDLLEHVAGTVWVGAVILAYVDKVLHESAAWWGFINGSYFAGAILGGILVMAFSKWMEARLIKALFLGSFSMAVLTFAYAGTTTPLIALILCLIMGPPYQAREIAQRTLFQTETSLEQMPKVFAAHNTLTYAVFGIAALGMGYLADLFPVQTVYFISAALCGCAALISLTIKMKEPAPQPSPAGYKQKRAS
ncbi:MFS transporter [Lihuaxuella thermophila]|uniref:Predicted arabinose efflux permease, MFS family n=1 Tax=Lihuaxuella thermophila TaxID=1173111 RepID=A0A1H8D7B8_9BACL|nr:MFS transporter [Lihuaxuella thermophila]SEN03213.1 Predicted arabinose efflux permease, MFS family [Lihuaxuella thermophila]